MEVIKKEIPTYKRNGNPIRKLDLVCSLWCVCDEMDSDDRISGSVLFILSKFYSVLMESCYCERVGRSGHISHEITSDD